MAHIGFDELTAMLAAKGASDPAGLAAHIGRKKYGHAGFQALAAAGRAKRDAMHDGESRSRFADIGYQADGQRRYPIDTADHAQLTWVAIHEPDNAARYDKRSLAKVKARTAVAMRAFGLDPEPVAQARVLSEAGLLLRSSPSTYARVFALDDIQISRSGDGRTVEAYAATFGNPYEVKDQHGHYNEVIERGAFNRTLQGAGRNAMCVYNHGMTIHGTPDGMASLPLGKPLEIKPDGKGLLTITRYNDGPWADSVLASIRNGDIKAQSFRGQIYRSSPNGAVPRRRKLTDSLPTVTRHELGLTDYGPTPSAVNETSAIVAVRSAADILEAIQFLDADEREELLRAFGSNLDTTPEEDPVDQDLLAEIAREDALARATATSDDTSGPGTAPPAQDPPQALRSAADITRRIRAELIRRSA